MKINIKFLKNYNWYLIAALIISILIPLILQSSILFDKYTFSDDVEHQVAYLYSFQDTELFKNDYIKSIVGLFNCIGFNFIYYVGLLFIDDLILLSKLIILPLSFISSLYLFKIGKEIKDDFCGFIISTLFIFTHIKLLSAGTQNSFLFPLLIIFLYYFIKKHYFKMMLTIAIMTIIYAPSALIAYVAYFLSFFKVLNKRIFLNCSKKAIVYFILTGLISFSIYLPTMLITEKEKFLLNQYIPKKEVFANLINPINYHSNAKYLELNLNGRRSLFSGNSIESFLVDILSNNNPRISLTLIKGKVYHREFLLLFAFCMLIVLRKKINKMPLEVNILLLSGLIMYILSFCLMLLLFYPGRYFAAPWSLYLITFISVNFESFVNQINSSLCKNLNLKESSHLINKFNLFLIFYLLLFLVDFKILSPDYSMKKVKKNHTPVFNFIEKLPKDVLIAAPIKEADYIPLLSKKSVYISFEVLDLTQELRRRAYAFYDAYFATDQNDLKDFCRNENIDYILVNKESFIEKSHIELVSPYKEYIIDKIRKNNNKKGAFVLEKIDDNKKIYDSNYFYILDCKML